MKALLSILLALHCFSASAQPERAPVELSHSGSDEVGNRLAFEIREVLRSTQGLRLVTETEADPRLVIHLVTTDAGTTATGVSTAASITIAYEGRLVEINGYFMTSRVQVCGRSRTQECARDIVASVDTALQRLRRDWPNLARALR